MKLYPNTIRYWLERANNYTVFIFMEPNVTFYAEILKTEEVKANLNEAFRIQAVSDKFDMKESDVELEFFENLSETETKSLNSKQDKK